jgi:diguanylate cyclase (GGDEF)-like protein
LREEKRLANTDPLTGVLNRRAIQAELEKLVRTAIMRAEPGAIGMADANFLKNVNDRYGHDAGDEFLRQIANALVMEGARVGRLGGDEFVVIIPNATRVQVEAYMALVDWRLDTKDSPEVTPSISVGFAFYPEEGTAADELLALADRRMYDEKKKLKDQLKLLRSDRQPDQIPELH